MVRAELNDKERVVGILAQAFDTSPGINAIIKNDGKRIFRIKKLMEYAFDTSYLYGDIFLSDDKNACAILRFPERKKNWLKSIWLLLGLTFYSVGFFRIKRILGIEEVRKRIRHTTDPIAYLWFIGVDPVHQGMGVGDRLLNEIIEYSTKMHRPIYLETAIIRNVPWYKKFGFIQFHELDADCRLYFMKRELVKQEAGQILG